jgi:hypothetical protein
MGHGGANHSPALSMAKSPTPKRTRGDQRGESLLSPVTDPGYWPYERLSGGLQETVAGRPEPPDPLGLVPEYRGSKDEEDDFNGKE